jgi:hypothetical protein
MHPWAKVATPVALVGLGAVAAYGAFRATDPERGPVDRIASATAGIGAAVGATVLGAKLGIRGATIGDDAMRAVRQGGSYEAYAWPKGTAALTRGGATWWVTPHEAIGESLVVGGLAGGILGGLGGGVVGAAAHGD